jgi:uncharacterized protein (DUF1800 family)
LGKSFFAGGSRRGVADRQSLYVAGKGRPCCKLLLVVGLLLVSFNALAAGLDRNNNQQSDVWEMVFGATGLAAATDADGDHASNQAESVAGTDPRAAQSVLGLAVRQVGAGQMEISWDGAAGKLYQLLSSPTLAPAQWQTNTSVVGAGLRMTQTLPANAAANRFLRLTVADLDSDGDQLTDWEELQLGFDPNSANTGRYQTNDFTRVSATLNSTNTINVSAMDPDISERWPDAGLVVIRRTGGLQPLTIHFAITGTATRGADYTMPSGNSIALPAGAREAWIEFWPVADADGGESAETIVLTLQAGTGYRLGSNTTATVNLANETPASPPNAKAATRFLLQAAFGPDADSVADADIIPENVEDVMARGYEGWITNQFAIPVGRLQPFVEWAELQNTLYPDYNDPRYIGGEHQEAAWWGRVLGAPQLWPAAPTNAPYDVLRQRVAWSLSQIFVVSDRSDDLVSADLGFANYYDMLLRHSFGNFRDLLHDVTMHPVMGLYLSHLGNKKPDPVNRIYPDENYAREIMQLFSIGLWELNQDGTRRLDTNGQPIAAYDNRNITEFARVFTGLAFGGSNTLFGTYPRDYTAPMGAWDEHHDLNPKTLLRGATTPARAASPGTNGLATRADINAAIDNLFNHPNVGPFFGRLLIQRLVTSNPSTGYVARVAAAFANNGAGTRGDMKAVVRAILLDPEARDPARMADPTFGKLREPLLRCVNLGRAFNAKADAGWYPLDTFFMDHVQEPFKSPSVFNFYLPGYSPPGPITQAGLVAPEFQIVNASSAVSAANYFWNAVWGGMHRWGSARPELTVKLNLDQEMLLTVPASAVTNQWPNIEPFDPDPLLRRLDLALTGGTLTPPQFQIIREHVERVRWPTWEWHRERVRLAIYLVVNTPEFCVLR